MIKRLLVLYFLSVCLLQTQSHANRFSATTGKISLSGSASSFTIQQPDTKGKQVIFETANIYCSVACEVSQSQNGTAATATSSPVLSIQPVGPTPTATAWSSSNVGGGTAVGGILEVPAAAVAVLSLDKIQFAKSSTSSTNYTITVNGITGTVIITYYWSEQ